MQNVVSLLRGDGEKHFVDTLSGNINVDDLQRSGISVHKGTVLVTNAVYKKIAALCHVIVFAQRNRAVEYIATPVTFCR